MGRLENQRSRADRAGSASPEAEPGGVRTRRTDDAIECARSAGSPRGRVALRAVACAIALFGCAGSGCAGFEDTREPPPPECPSNEPALSSIANPIERVEARYPRGALRSGITGFVCLNFTVDAEGLVSEVCIADAMPDDLFDRAAGEALAQWRFEMPTASFRSGTCMMFDVR